MAMHRGYSLVSVLVSMAIGGMVMFLIVSSIFQTIRVTARSNSSNVAIVDVDNVSGWLNRDLSLTQTTDLLPIYQCPATKTSIRVDWIDETGWASGNPAHFAQYYIQSGTTLLKRNYDGNVRIVGRNVTGVTFCQEANGVIHMTITSVGEGVEPATKSLFFYVTPRPEG